MKIGTAAVTSSDGRLALTGIGFLVEQVCEVTAQIAAFHIQNFQ